MVYRDGQIQTESKFLVPGDLMYVDCWRQNRGWWLFIKFTGLQIDESVLTGESISATKSGVQSWRWRNKRREQSFSRHTGKSGRRLYRGGTGNIPIRQIGRFVGKIISLKTPLQKKFYHLVRYVALVAMFFCGICWFVFSIEKWLDQRSLAGLTIAISLIRRISRCFSVFLIMVSGAWQKKKLWFEMAMVELFGFYNSDLHG